MPQKLGRVVVVLAVAATIPAVFAPSGEAAKRSKCKPAGSKTIAQNRGVRVYKVRVAGESSSETVLYACRRSTGKRSRLDRAFDDGYVTSATFTSVRLRGYYVAWVSSSTDVSCKAACPPGYEATSSAVEVFDVRRRRARTVDAAPLGEALVLSSRGGVAWASRSGTTGPVEIRASVRAGDNRLLDSGDIDPASLAIEITIISWTHTGEEHFARLS
jgi:hypothetical protein